MSNKLIIVIRMICIIRRACSFGGGHREGRAKGEFEKVRQIASRLSIQGMSIEEIAEVAGLEVVENKIILERKVED